MLFEDRLRAAHCELENAGIKKSRANPPLVRLLRKTGLEMPPPQYWGFWAHFLPSALLFGGAMGLST